MKNTHRPFNTSHLARDIASNLPFSFTKVRLDAGAADLPLPCPAPRPMNDYDIAAALLLIASRLKLGNPPGGGES